MKRETRTRRSAGERRPGPLPALESPRDAGLTVRPRRSSRRPQKRPIGLAVLVALALVLAATASIAMMAPKATTRAKASVASVWKAVTTSTPAPEASAAEKPAAVPTPFFASYRGVKLHIPVPISAVTVLAFHQSSYNDTVQMKRLVREGSVAAAKTAADKARYRAKHHSEDLAPADAGDQTHSNGVWTGSALELWRAGRPSKSDTAIDCGAKPGTPVFSLLDGTVMQIRPYKLYGKYSDFEIDIRPDGWSDVYVVVLHVTDPAVTEGQHVIGGVTKLAKVRCLSALVPGLQLRTYSADGGNHTHVQLNRVDRPNLPWIVGSDPPGLVRRSN